MRSWQHRTKLAAEAKYLEAAELYRSTTLSCQEICRICEVDYLNFGNYIASHHQNLMLARYDVVCSKEETRNIKLDTMFRQLPITREKYRKAIDACASLEFIVFNVSQIAHAFNLDGTGLGRQLRTHYPEILKFREDKWLELGIDDHLPRGMRAFSKEQYAKAVELLSGSNYLTIEEVAIQCNVSQSGLLQHLRFYHRDLVRQRIKIRKNAIRQQLKGKITGRGTIHSPKQGTVEKYADALYLYRTTPMSIRQIAMKTGVSKKGFYEYLHSWHKDLICQRRNIPYKEGERIDFSQVRKYNPATAAKYAEAIYRLKECDLPMAVIAAEFGLHPETFRNYLKEHEPELYARHRMVKVGNGRVMSNRSMDKYGEAVRLYGETRESLKSLARRFGVNECSLRDFIKRHFRELTELRKKQSQKDSEI